jgi:hypothetical protein
MADVSCSLVVIYLQCNGKLKKISRCCTSWLLYTLFTSWYYPWAHTCRVMYPGSYTVKGKVIPVQAWTGPEGSRRLRFPHFKTVCIWRRLGYQPFARAVFTPRKYSWYSLLLGAESTSGPWCGRKDYVNEKLQWHHRELNLRPCGL